MGVENTPLGGVAAPSPAAEPGTAFETDKASQPKPRPASREEVLRRQNERLKEKNLAEMMEVGNLRYELGLAREWHE